MPVVAVYKPSKMFLRVQVSLVSVRAADTLHPYSSRFKEVMLVRKVLRKSKVEALLIMRHDASSVVKNAKSLP